LSKSQKRSNREKKKPKREVPQVIAAGQTISAGLAKTGLFPGAKNK